MGMTDQRFQYREDLEEWLKPMTYADFWQAMTSYRLKLPNKLQCDEKIAQGYVDRKMMLDGLKYIAAVQISSHLGLDRRPIVMPDYSAG
jgi:surfactin synthase thioesterase subunit